MEKRRATAKARQNGQEARPTVWLGLPGPPGQVTSPLHLFCASLAKHLHILLIEHQLRQLLVVLSHDLRQVCEAAINERPHELPAAVVEQLVEILVVVVIVEVRIPVAEFVELDLSDVAEAHDVERLLLQELTVDSY